MALSPASSRATSGAAVVADSVANLGSGSSGVQGLLRIGSSPYQFVSLTYDATYAKWISQEWLVVGSDSSASVSLSSASYAVLGGPTHRTFILGYKALYDAGLRLEARWAAQLSNDTGGATTACALQLYEFASGDTNIVQLGSDVENGVSITGAVLQYVSCDWIAFNPAAPTKANAQVLLSGKRSAGTATCAVMEARLRWVSA